MLYSLNHQTFNMSFKIVFLRHLTETYPKLSSLNLSRKLWRSNKAISLRKKKSSLNNGSVWEASGSMQFGCTFYRSQFATLTESTATRDQPNIIINVQPVDFEDISFEQSVPHDELLRVLQNCRSVEEQMTALVETLTLSKEDVKKRMYFCKTIESLLRPFFYDIKIQMFGSSVNGFGFKGCDIDMSFETSIKPKDETSYLDRPDVPLISEVTTGRVTPLEISQLPLKEQLLFIHSILLEYYRESQEPTIFINAHIPLVRFYHDKYNLKCDLSGSNRVAFANTKLMYLFAKLDERVIPLMMTLRYWAKHVELIGKGLMFNTYTISLLMIYFLQTRNPPILPSGQHILTISDKLEVDDMTDESFLTISKSIPPSQNTETLDELLRGFFFFYLYFDFTRVICPLIAAAVPREEFFSTASKKFRMSSICVQDPMLVTHNVAELVEFKYCKMLCKEIMIACKMFQDSSILNPTSDRWGMMCLLDKPEKYSLRDISSETQFSFTVPLISKKFNDQDLKQIAMLSTETVLHILQYVLLFECRTVDLHEVYKILKQQDESVEKQKKHAEAIFQSKNEMLEMLQQSKKRSLKIGTNFLQEVEFPESSVLEEFRKFNEEHDLVMCATCTASKNTWLGRDFVELKSFNVTGNLLDKECFISVNAAKQNEQNALESKAKSFSFLYESYISLKSDSESLIVKFRPLHRVFFNPILGLFLKEYIPKLIKEINSS